MMRAHVTTCDFLAAELVALVRCGGLTTKTVKQATAHTTHTHIHTQNLLVVITLNRPHGVFD